MKVNFKKLWVLCAEKEMSKAELRKRAGLSSATFTRLRKNEEVNLSVILKIADVVDCNAGDMMDFVKEGLPERRKSLRILSKGRLADMKSDEMMNYLSLIKGTVLK
ncbi:MAG: helix-turn-helix domain-containing protein [Oscillospiraceae bacterium]